MTTDKEKINQSLAGLRSISLAEMDAVSLMDRVDTKYIVALNELVPLLDSLARDYRVLEVEGLRSSPYSTLYFDSPTSECYFQHHNGKADRYKYRTRRYVASGAAFFEIKHRTNKGRTVKNRRRLDAVRTEVDNELAQFAESATGKRLRLEPKIWTEFSRTTLVSVDPPERVTIDVDLRFVSGSLEESLTGVAVVEVKQGVRTQKSVIREIFRERRIGPRRLSKYCIGRALLDPSMKQNRFKSKMLTLRAHGRKV